MALSVIRNFNLDCWKPSQNPALWLGLHSYASSNYKQSHLIQNLHSFGQNWEGWYGNNGMVLQLKLWTKFYTCNQCDWWAWSYSNWNHQGQGLCCHHKMQWHSTFSVKFITKLCFNFRTNPFSKERPHSPIFRKQLLIAIENLNFYNIGSSNKIIIQFECYRAEIDFYSTKDFISNAYISYMSLFSFTRGSWGYLLTGDFTFFIC